jgi:hypothetical protein
VGVRLEGKKGKKENAAKAQCKIAQTYVSFHDDPPKAILPVRSVTCG